MEKITFEDIQKANETLKSTDIKGKKYIEVNERIRAFRMVYPTGTISTDIVNLENGVVIIKATILDENGATLATGYAYEKENSTFINKTSYIENCETSAVGRALGMAGFGIDTSVASAEEVQNAMVQQEADEKLSEKEARVLYEFMKKRGLTDEKITETLQTKYSVSTVNELTKSQYVQIIRNLQG